MKRNIFVLFFLIIGGILFSSFQFHSIFSSKNLITEFYIDTLNPVLTKKGKLGASGYFIQKPVDCIENVIMESVNERTYSIEPRESKEQLFHGSCNIVVDQIYDSRMKSHADETSFADTILGKIITVKQYLKDNMICREGEIINGKDFIFFYCTGVTQWELRKYYYVAKSLSK